MVSKDIPRRYKKIFFKMVLSLIEPLKCAFILSDYTGFYQNKTVLDLGCGEGYWTNVLAKKARNVFALDLSMDSVKLARNNHANYLVGDGGVLPFANNSFDFIWCEQVLEHIENDKTVLKEIYRILRPTGVVCLGTPCSEGLLKYDFAFSKMLKKFLPASTRKYFGSLVEGDIYLLTKRGFHVRVGYSESDFQKLCKENNMKFVKADYSCKSQLYARFFEFGNSLPNTLAIVFLPILELFAIFLLGADKFSQKDGLIIRCLIQKEETKQNLKESLRGVRNHAI